MPLSRFMQRIDDVVVAPALENAVALRTGVITAAYYLDRDTGIEDYRKSPASVVDVSILDSAGNIAETLSQIPMLRQIGISSGLPPVGSIGLIGYVGGKNGMKFLIGYIDSGMTESTLSDNVAPKVPPALKTR